MPLVQSDVPGVPCYRGKVRDVYDLGDRLVLVATDRISAFDWVLPTPIPGKGEVLTQLSRWWFNQLGEPHHVLSFDPADAGPAFANRPELIGRTTVCRKATVVPFECVVRGHLAGSGWAEYRTAGTLASEPLPAGLRQSDALPAPRFTPATKAVNGHDENVTFAQMADVIGMALATELRDRSLAVFLKAAVHASRVGLVLADTKFEWGHLPDGQLILIDEALTPDSSRYWEASAVVPGQTPPSFDKQPVRDWLVASGWDQASPPPELPTEVVAATVERYRAVVRRIAG